MLRKKMLRDLKENKGSYIASAIVITIGLMVFTSYSMVIENLKLSQTRFYTSETFADGFAQIQAMPPAEVQELAETEGIAQLAGRLVKDVQVLLPEREENVYLRLISVDPQDADLINGMQLLQGIPLSANSPQIWVDNKFFAANSLALNDELEIIADGKKRSLRVVGLGRSPEFIYALRTTSDLYPNPKTFGIAFIPLAMMQNLFPGQDTINDLVFTLQPGADYDDVAERLKPRLRAYGLNRMFPRKEQTSHFLLSEEIKGLEAAAKAMPIVFLSIAAVILSIMLHRMIEQQRGQIGILKALGYTRREIILHYLSYALIIGAVGGFVGGLAGTALSYPFTSLYQTFFNMPGLNGRFSPLYLVLSVLMALAFALLAGYQGSKKVLTLEPAEAMRPPAPPEGKKIWLEGLPFFWDMLTVQGRMAVRNLSRNKGRSIFILIGITLTFAIQGFTWSMNDLIQKMIFDQYEKVETYNAKVTLAKPMEQKKVIRELFGFPGVHLAEAMAEVPVKLNNQWRQKDAVVLGLPEKSSLYNILDKNETKVDPPVNGLLLSERLAELLEAKVGTRLRVESPLFKDPEKDQELQVIGVIPQYLGLNAYMELNSLQEFLQQKGLVTSLMLRVDKDSIPLLQEEYRQSAAVMSIDDQASRMTQTKELLDAYGMMIFIYVLIGVIIGFAIIYNSAVITLSERSHELASMMVLGMTPAEVLSVVTFEQWFIGALGMLAGIPAAKLFLTGISRSISNDVYSMPDTVTATSFLLALLVTAVAIWAAQQMAAQKIKKLSLVETLKARE